MTARRLLGSPRPTRARPRRGRPSSALIIGCKAWEPASSTVVLRSAARLLVGTRIESNRRGRAKFGRAVPKSRGRRVAAGAAFIEMRHI